MEYTDIDNINVLYIEDDESLYQLICEFFKTSRGTEFNVVSKTTLEEGLKYLTSHCLYEIENKVDIVLLDLNLPNSRGITTFKSVKQACPYLPIVIVSAFEDIACECVRQGAQDYLVKPEVSRSNLIRSMKYAIQRHKLENACKASEEKYRRLVEMTGAAMWSVDLVEMKFTYVNETFCDYTGYSKKELLEMSVYDLITDEGSTQLDNRVKRMEEGEYIDDTVVYEIVQKSGNSIWVMATAQYEENSIGRVVSANVVAIDITDRVEEEKKEKKKETEIYSLLEEKIKNWSTELLIKEKENKKNLTLINNELSDMVHDNGSN